MIAVEKPGSPAEVLEHHGVKGMRWGVRNESRSSGGTSGKTSRGAAVKSRVKRVGRATGRALDDIIFEANAKNAHEAIVTKASERYVKSLPRLRAKHGEYGKLRNRMRHPFAPEAKAYREDAKKTYLRHLEKTANEMTNRRGTRQYTLKENGKPNTSQYYWTVSTKEVKHAEADGTFRVRPIFDDEGWIVDLEIVKGDMAQTMDRGYNALIHMGIEV